MAWQFYWDGDDFLSAYDDGLDEEELESLGIHPVEDDDDEEDAYFGGSYK